MTMRSGILVGIASLLFSASAARAEAPAKPRPGLVEGAQLEVELLQLELNTEKVQLQQELQVLKQSEFGFGSGGFGGPFNPPPSDPEDQKKALAAMRASYGELKAATLETARKLAEARSRLAALESPAEAPAPAIHPPSSAPSTLAERRAALALLALEYDVDKALLREVLTKLGQVELERSLTPNKGPGAEDAARFLDRLREYVEARKKALLERGIALELKKQELAELEKRGEDAQ
jgi:hypothetical protein